MGLGRQQKKKLKQLPKALAEWLDAAKQFPSLSGSHLQMARELRISLKLLAIIARHPEQTGGLSLEQHIERRYRKTFGRERPTGDLPLPNQLLRDWKTTLTKRRLRRERNQRRRNAQKT